MRMLLLVDSRLLPLGYHSIGDGSQAISKEEEKTNEKEGERNETEERNIKAILVVEEFFGC